MEHNRCYRGWADGADMTIIVRLIETLLLGVCVCTHEYIHTVVPVEKSGVKSP